MTLSLEQMKANRKLWVDALRSGKYKQGKSFLLNNRHYCCLGVLAKCAGVPDRKIRREMILQDFPDAMDFVGLVTDNGGFGGCALSSENDNGKSFAEIADIIESEPKGLFIESVQP